jgi:hypothetical protein
VSTDLKPTAFEKDNIFTSQPQQARCEGGTPVPKSISLPLPIFRGALPQLPEKEPKAQALRPEPACAPQRRSAQLALDTKR